MNPTAVQFFSDPQTFKEPENLYLEVRRLEGRILPDKWVKNLPNYPASSLFAQEWRWRKRSLNRLIKRLPKKSGLKILDLGCGNAWMANRLAENPNNSVWAMDLNQEELAQGARLFGRENLLFVYADLLSNLDIFPESSGITIPEFDRIILAASVQYFPNLELLIQCLRKILSPTGEIHILDSMFYITAEAQSAAQQRSLAYYTQLGKPEMARHYHHHLWPEAQTLGAVNLNNTLNVRILQKIKWLPPFPWLRFQKFK